jgi:hypothetical protein
MHIQEHSWHPSSVVGTTIIWPLSIEWASSLGSEFALIWYISRPYFFLIGIVRGGVQLGPLDTAATNSPIVPYPGDYDTGEINGMIGKGNRSTRRKPAPVPLCPSQTPHAARTRTWAAAVGSQRPTAWATARPNSRPSIQYLPSG